MAKENRCNNKTPRDTYNQKIKMHASKLLRRPVTKQNINEVLDKPKLGIIEQTLDKTTKTCKKRHMQMIIRKTNKPKKNF